VIGGLFLATLSTLFVVPIVYTFARKKPPVDFDKRIEEEQHEGESDQDKNGGQSAPENSPQPA
jgi:hypothetical protein